MKWKKKVIEWPLNFGGTFRRTSHVYGALAAHLTWQRDGYTISHVATGHKMTRELRLKDLKTAKRALRKVLRLADWEKVGPRLVAGKYSEKYRRYLGLKVRACCEQ